MTPGQSLNHFSLIRSWSSLTSHTPHSSVSVSDITFAGMHDLYFNSGLVEVDGGQYAMVDGQYEIDLRSMAAVKTAPYGDTVSSMLVSGRHMFVVQYELECRVLCNGMIERYVWEVYGKMKRCKNSFQIHGRWSQQRGDDIFVIQYSTNDLYTVKWSEIKTNRQAIMKCIFSSVEDFFAAEDGTLGTLLTDGSLVLSTDSRIDLKLINDAVDWTIITKIRKLWIASGDRQDKATLAVITNSGIRRSRLSLTLTANGKVTYLGKHTSIYCIKPIRVRKGSSLFLACERDGFCHLISISDTGRLRHLQAVAVHTGSERSIILSVSNTDKEDEVIVGGVCWTKKLMLKLK